MNFLNSVEFLVGLIAILVMVCFFLTISLYRSWLKQVENEKQILDEENDFDFAAKDTYAVFKEVKENRFQSTKLVYAGELVVVHTANGHQRLQFHKE